MNIIIELDEDKEMCLSNTYYDNLNFIEFVVRDNIEDENLAVGVVPIDELYQAIKVFIGLRNAQREHDQSTN